MSYIPNYEIEEEIERLASRHWADAKTRRYAWIVALGKLPPLDHETRARVGRLIKVFDDHIERHKP